MRRPLNPYDALMLIIGFLIKFLFVSMFSCTVLVVLAGLFGAGDIALALYQAIWAIVWKVCVSLMGAIAIVTMLSGLHST
jgi:hypothetical protein